MDAIEKLQWYALRWKIEVFHKTLKSGCRAEDARLPTGQRLANLIALFCLVSWRVFWVTMLNRTAPNEPPAAASTEVEIDLLDRLVKDRQPCRRKTLSHYLTKIARLGGYLARASDPPPGNTVMWRGMSRLTDITLEAQPGLRPVTPLEETGRRHPDHDWDRLRRSLFRFGTAIGPTPGATKRQMRARYCRRKVTVSGSSCASSVSR